MSCLRPFAQNLHAAIFIQIVCESSWFWDILRLLLPDLCSQASPFLDIQNLPEVPAISTLLGSPPREAQTPLFSFAHSFLVPLSQWQTLVWVWWAGIMGKKWLLTEGTYYPRCFCSLPAGLCSLWNLKVSIWLFCFLLQHIFPVLRPIAISKALNRERATDYERVIKEKKY